MAMLTRRCISMVLSLWLLPCLLSMGSAVRAEVLRYDIGSPVLTDIWVDPVAGNDTRGGNSRAQALRTVREAWRRLPSVTTTTGYRIQLMAGTFPESSLPSYWEGKRGSQAFPLIIQSADGPRTARLQGNVNVFQVGYLYWLGLTFDNPGDVFHCEQCDHLLIRDSRLTGGIRQAHETIKMNQSRYIYIEDSEVSESYENAIDFVAVQYGHIVRNHLHDADDWCIYLKGGSAYFRVEDNEIDHCGTGGFTAGQGTGFEYMTPPWLHYEAYGLRVVNNVIHDTEGAGLGVNGGYAILMAYNTLYRVGSRSHVAEFVFGGRSCDGDSARCAQNLALGGWGTTLVGSEGEPIPNASVYFYNNLIFNPAGYRSAWQHFAIHGPRLPTAGSGIPSPAVTDSDLRIRGNVIWNGPADHPLGLDEDSGCQPGNPTCNAGQLLADNAINTLRPELVNPEQGDFHPLPGGSLFGRTSIDIPAFPVWTDFTPAVPAGNPDVAVSFDRDGLSRPAGGPVGAYATGSGPGVSGVLFGLAAQGFVGIDNQVQFGAFTIAGDSRRVLIRGLGPTLSQYVPGALANPRIALSLNGATEPLVTNDDWRQAANAQEIETLKHQPAYEVESAILTTLQPGVYNLHLSGSNGTTGIGMFQVYAIEGGGNGELEGLAAQGMVGTDNQVQFGAFTITGAPRKVLIRGLGPALDGHVPGALRDPRIALSLNGAPTPIETNDDWADANNAAEIIALNHQPKNPTESAILRTLEPGVYNVHLSGSDGTEGIGMFQVYTVE